MLNHMTANWVCYIAVYANLGDCAFTNIQIDLGLTDTEYGVLSGVTYTLITGFFGLVAGTLADLCHRKHLLVFSGVIWSILTMTQSFSVGFKTILIPRVLMQVATSSCNAVAHSLLHDYFNSSYRARALSIYNLGVYFGFACSSLTILFVKAFGWRTSFVIVGSLSLLISILTSFISEPQRGAHDIIKLNESKRSKNNESKKNILNKFYIVLTNKVFLLIICGSIFRFIGGYSIGFKSPTFFKKAYPEYLKYYSVMNAITG